MSLKFVQDAICLSGLTGSKLKCAVIGQYYPFWWGITSGGQRENYKFPTAIVELDAATGEAYIKDTNEVILGSSGHALDLKCNNPNTGGLKVILVENDVDCYGHLKKVIRRRWGNVDIDLAEGPSQFNSSNIYLLNTELDSALSNIEKIKLGNALFFFDPLRSVEYQTIEKVASNRIKTYYKTGTEFIIFVFTSDWFLGRDDFAPLPTSVGGGTWSIEEKRTVLEADAFFGNKDWRGRILNSNPIHERERNFLELYRDTLHKWFRYILPLPFNPKENQIFHLILCSNYETGVRRTREFYAGKTRNPKYSPDNSTAFKLFRKHHPEIFIGLSGVRKPPQWRVLWTTVRSHEDGICDCMCSDYIEIEGNTEARQQLLDWLEKEEYLNRLNIDNAWKSPIIQYKLNWVTIKKILGIDPPSAFEPLSLKRLSLEEISQ